MATKRAARGRTPRFSLRPATAADHDFALALFLESPRELLEPQGKWEEARFIARFQEVFEPGAAQIIRAEGADIGWMHVSDLADRIHLHYMLIAGPYRSRGIGTSLIRSFLDLANAARKPLTLNVMRENGRALTLYHRLGFHTNGGDEQRVHMQWRKPGKRVLGPNQRLRRS